MIRRWHEVRNATPWTSGLLPGDLADVPYAAPGERLRASAEAHGWAYARLDLAGVTDKAGFMDACARDLRLPGYFGRNWDALWDCLTDPGLLPEPGRRLLVVHGWHRFAEHDPDAWAAARNVLRETAEHWRDTATPLVVLVRT
ncbi:barstar family protein [Yinghuangia seranimata]|uniref:barstar family protein n=1 Tax=Yinghuangia seranimata TaxID=408067 RepID=UPI00248ADC5B|nr:barstar family protein [Yinghuangia seranimata]MDI2126151.1 barstar family protein [Yinghuangia seranimata]